MSRIEETVGVRRRFARWAARLEQTLWVVGLVCWAGYAVACAHDAWLGDRADARFVRSVERALLAEFGDQSDWSEGRRQKFAERLAADARAGGDLAPIGRLEIPTGGVSVAVLEGTSDAVLDRAAGRIEGTALPAEAGNMGIAGHRDGHFRGLREVAVGDALYFASVDGIAEYRVVRLEVVEPHEVEVLDPTPGPSITLVTCYPFVYLGDAPQRFIVRADRVREHAWKTDEPVEAQLAALRVDPDHS